MNVLIAGGAGFIGLNLAELILRQGGHVVIYDTGRVPSAARRHFDALPGSWTEVHGSVTDEEAVVSILSEQRISYVFYGAAITSGPQRERDSPESVLSINLLGLATMAKSAAKTGIRRLLNISSGAAYGLPAEDGSYALHEARTREQPATLYSLSKLASEVTLRRIAELTGLDALSVRLSSIFGPWERDTGFRDTLSAPMQASVAAQRGERVILSRRECRDWTYSRHVAEALVLLIQFQRPRYDLYNISSGRTWSTADWCDRLRNRFPAFRYRFADSGETANVDLYTATDRLPLDPGRLQDDTGHHLPDDIDVMFADFETWLDQYPDFWSDEPAGASPSRSSPRPAGRQSA